MSYKGYFKPRNPQKYAGNPSTIVYRSSWELKLMIYLDSHKDVIQWASEELFVPYLSPLDKRVHRYFPDFLVKKRNKAGQVDVLMIEVKPAVQAQAPEMKPRKSRKKYVSEVMTWGVNEAKWEAAEAYCKTKGWKFLVFTEHQLNILF